MTALLEGELAERASEALDDISRCLVAARHDLPSLGRGSAGLALANAYLDPVFPDRGHGDRVGVLVDDALATVASAPPWLVAGRAGVGWLLEHLTKDDPDADPGAALATATAARLRRTGAGDAHEYMHGVAGLAVYAAERAERPGGRALFDAVADDLVARAIRDEHGARWGGAAVDLGLAHGGAGVIAVLALLVRHRVALEHTEPLLRDACRWMLAQRLSGHDAAFGRTSGDAAPARTAWCYGDPGVAWALLLAARALDDRKLRLAATTIAAVAARRAASGVVDAGFCHGAAGLAHIFHRMALLSGSEELLAAARGWIARALELRDPAHEACAGYRAINAAGAVDEPGLLFGVAGIGLVLATATGAIDPTWDAPLMIDAAPRAA